MAKYFIVAYKLYEADALRQSDKLTNYQAKRVVAELENNKYFYVKVANLDVIEKEVEALFYEVGFGAQIDIFNLAKITKAGVDAYLAGADVKQAVIDAVAQYREN